MNFLRLFGNDFKAIFPETFLILAISWLLVFGVIYGTAANKNKQPNIIKGMSWLSILTLLITTLLVINNPYTDITIFNKMFVVDDLTTLVKTILLLSASGCILISFDYFKEEKIQLFEYAILILLAVLGMLIITSANDFITMYLAIELQSLALYVLAAFKRNTEFSTEAGLKYFILGALASGILLFGCSLVYGFTGLTNFEDLLNLLTLSNTFDGSLKSNGVVVGIIFISVGLLFKLGAAPFHMWVPDVYEGSPTSTTAFFAIVPKIAVTALFIRLFVSTFSGLIDEWQQTIIICSVLSMLIATLGALYQVKIKRLLAYSAIGHVGYILIGLATGTPEGIQASILYLILYILMSLATFGIVLSLRKEHQLSENTSESSQIKYISDLNNLAKTNPVIAISFATVLFSMAGMPPLAGFFGKMYIFLAAVESNLFGLAIIGVVTSVASAVFYVRLIKIMYFENKAEESLNTDIQILNLPYRSMDKEKIIVVSFCLLCIVCFFIQPGPLVLLTHKIALTLCL